MDNALQHGVNGTNYRDGRGTSRQNVQGNTEAKRQPEVSQQVGINLDLFSTSQTKHRIKSHKSKNSDRRIYDECSNNAPYFGYQIEGKRWGIVQGCCNDWTCPRCGQQRAREEYGRIVSGAREIGKRSKLYMLTITCEGEGLSVQEAENNYLVWTNRLVSSLRVQTKRNSQEWAYASVTERQDRGHPHSHYLTTYCPPDAVLVKKDQWKSSIEKGRGYVARHDTLQSAILEQASIRAGLGWVYDLSELRSVEGASRYVAKYLFKETIFTTVWPKGWRRVRYSQNWPKLPDVNTDAIILLSNDDWERLARVALVVITKDNGARKTAQKKLSHADVIIQ
jgi:hypothetical protein